MPLEVIASPKMDRLRKLNIIAQDYVEYEIRWKLYHHLNSLMGKFSGEDGQKIELLTTLSRQHYEEFMRKCEIDYFKYRILDALDPNRETFWRYYPFFLDLYKEASSITGWGHGSSIAEYFWEMLYWHMYTEYIVLDDDYLPDIF